MRRLDWLCIGCRLLGEYGGDDRVRGGEFDLGGAAGDDAQVDGESIRCRWLRCHSGMFPCFFGGRLARLPLRARNALMMATRVAAGSMMPSSSPRSAARNGLATL